jgi:AcrR family transcriptional regulator
MGYSKAQKARTHKRIVTIASKRFREKGLAGFGIAELMKEAGLTVGGFYKHFDSRDDLVAEAINSAFGDWQRRAEARQVWRATRILRKADRRLSERRAPQESRYGLCLQRTGAGDRAAISGLARLPLNKSRTTLNQLSNCFQARINVRQGRERS